MSEIKTAQTIQTNRTKRLCKSIIEVAEWNDEKHNMLHPDQPNEFTCASRAKRALKNNGVDY